MNKHKHKLGWQPDVPDHRDHVFDKVVETPPSFVDLRPQMPPVYDQGMIGSCTANAIAGAVQFDREKLGHKPDFVPSRLFIYYNERLIEGTVHSDAGAQIRDGIKSLTTQGVAPETSWPYSDNPGSNEQTGAWEKGAKGAKKPTVKVYKTALTDKLISYQRVPQTSSGLKSCLASGYPVVFGFAVYENLWDSNGNPQTNIPMPSGRSVGGHAVMIVGYDDTKSHFIIRNSWGVDTGEAGYFYMPYAYVLNNNLCDDFWTIRVMEK